MSELAEQIRSIPKMIGLCAQSRPTFRPAREAWDSLSPSAVFTIARGTSDAAASYAARLFTLELGMPVCSFPPSLATMHGYRHSRPGAIALAISQSGASPDLVKALEAFDPDSRWALTNVDDSPLEKVSSVRFPICAGEERSVAATKSFACSLLQLALLVSELGGKAQVDHDDCAKAADDGLSRPADLESFIGATSAFVLGRGATLPIAQEAALKFKEAAGLHAEAISAAEVMHGPKALAGQNMPVLAFAPPGETGRQVASAAKELRELGSPVTLLESGQGASDLEAVLTQLCSFYVALLDLAKARGMDPDSPPALTKVTKTY